METMKRILFFAVLCLMVAGAAQAQEYTKAVKLSDVPDLQELVDTAYVNGDWSSAVYLQRKIVAVLEKEPMEKEGKRYSKAVGDLAYYEFILNDFSPAFIPDAQRAQELIAQYHGKNSEEYVAALNNLITMYSLNELDSVSEPLRWEMVERTRIVYGPESEEYCQALRAKATYCAYAKYYDMAINAQTEAVALARKLYGDDDELTIDAIEYLADFYARNGDGDGAIAALQPILDKAEASVRASAINALVPALVEGGQSAKAIELINKEVEMIEAGQMMEEEIPAPPETIDLLHSLARIYHEQGDTIHRDEALNHALTQSANIDGLNSPGFAKRLMDQAELCYNLGLYDHAHHLGSSAYGLSLAYCEKDRNKEFATHLTFLPVLAVFCHSGGDDVKAWEYFREMVQLLDANEALLQELELTRDDVLDFVVEIATEYDFPITREELLEKTK